jgi:anti-sigma regulatory factor (Ser/Thr protein kinase)
MKQLHWTRPPPPTWTEQAPPQVCGEQWQWDLTSIAQLPRLRSHLRRQLADGDSETDDESRAERFLLAFEELASNGLRHGGRPVRARVILTPDVLLIEVSDAVAQQPPHPAVDRDPSLGGLGLYLVAETTTLHGWHVSGGRKVVWACCR